MGNMCLLFYVSVGISHGCLPITTTITDTNNYQNALHIKLSGWEMLMYQTWTRLLHTYVFRCLLL